MSVAIKEPHYLLLNRARFSGRRSKTEAWTRVCFRRLVQARIQTYLTVVRKILKVAVIYIALWNV